MFPARGRHIAVARHIEEFAKTNPYLVEAELHFFPKKKVKEDEEMDHKISNNIDGMFKELKMVGYYVPQ